ncbi:hypothetical protein N7491_009506 [Penicillium cf. griseofulvum]|uniref:Uncharacterized protein n=1 Tax=Penicillium cf. griseofulvum TaxID=2972120 RepID=A0A9W9JTM6_9EURO|nr:hypothetical protein N7472_004900 [Penicillium cf. griseofulvum]KAJ5424290.1 hypothetical protein N7491_009506 [Penicillium cf. griseofulvum]KAJ5442468.1 hypothetical protein N7445_005475 [Penicillium cf. griseofulvum]
MQTIHTLSTYTIIDGHDAHWNNMVPENVSRNELEDEGDRLVIFMDNNLSISINIQVLTTPKGAMSSARWRELNEEQRISKNDATY